MAGFPILLFIGLNALLGIGLSIYLLWKATGWRREFLAENISYREYRRLIWCMMGINLLTATGLIGIGCLFLGSLLSGADPGFVIPFTMAITSFCAVVYGVNLYRRFL
jgi:hypothetical protein